VNEQVVRFRIGVMVLAAGVVTVILLIMFGETRGLFQSTYTIKIAFSEAPGVSQGSPIRRSGIVVGKVVDVEPMDEGGVLVTAEIQERMKLRHNEVCRISANLLGDSMLNFVRVQDGRGSKEPVEPGETLHGTVAPDPVTVVADMQERLGQAIGSVSRTSDDVGVVVRKMGDLLGNNEQRINSVIAKADDTLSVINETARNANEVVGSPHTKQQLKESLDQVPVVLQEIRTTLAKFNDTVVLMNRNLENIEGFTRPLGQRGEAVVDRLNRSVEKLDLVMEQMVTFSQGINSPEGTLGQLIHNRELYDNLNRVAVNVDDLTRQLQPILHDARVFSDKIARHPESLGVRGVIERNPGTKGVPVFGSPPMMGVR
jgi:phospholipid/cholesterol/gamma-HCH transport system substrate-binding protein